MLNFVDLSVIIKSMKTFNCVNATGTHDECPWCFGLNKFFVVEYLIYILNNNCRILK